MQWLLLSFWPFALLLLPCERAIRVTPTYTGNFGTLTNKTASDQNEEIAQLVTQGGGHGLPKLAASFACELGSEYSRGRSTMIQWLTAAHENRIQCPNLASKFGSPWGTSCPDSIEEVLIAIRRGSKKAQGGKSGTVPIKTDKYVLKVIPQEEFDSAIKFLSSFKNEPKSLIVPTCRLLRVKREHYLQISVNALLQIPANVKSPGQSIIYDLKGNWDYSARDANSSETPQKDKNFKSAFPHGLKIVDYMSSGDWNGGKLTTWLFVDTFRLYKVGLMDYSILAHVLDVTSAPSADKKAILTLNKCKPVFLAQASGKTFFVALSIIDILMHEDNRGAVNTICSGLTCSDCTVDDIDPIPAEEYRVRFVRMFGRQIKYKLQPCAPCLFSVTNNMWFPERGIGYTYFPTDYQIAESRKQIKERTCSWAPPTPSNGVLP